ncbi:MAG: T9SS type A sorting domain-containing protein [Chitinophagales bacterium]
MSESLTNEFNISTLPIGSYFLQFKNDGKTIVKRFVINR